ncbi:MAG: transposase [Inoviridae sp.]|nr:MAG: transposase [Inoviridae sp.]
MITCGKFLLLLLVHMFTLINHYCGVLIMSYDNSLVVNSWSPSLAESAPFCPCPPQASDAALISADDADGGILFVSIPVDSDLPFCPFCELAQLDVLAPYACQCEDF